MSEKTGMRVTFVFGNGSRRECEFYDGETVLAVAIRAGVNLDSRCEGNGVCGGCHVIIKDQSCISPVSAHEESGLDNVSNISLSSRLACQVVLNEKCDGLEIFVP